jgi:flagellar motor switch/type III secretory pathway protein FliN
MAVRSFTLIGADVLSAVQGMLQAVVHDWCADWGLAREELALECLRAWEGQGRLPAVPGWREAWCDGDAELALAWPADTAAQLQRLMFGNDHYAAMHGGAGGMAAAAAEAAWQALLRQLLAVTLPDARADSARPAASDAAWKHASGAVLMELRVGRKACHGLLNAAAWQGLVRQARLRGLLAAELAQPALPALDYAQLLSSLPVRLPVELGRVDVGLGSLASLGVGDVIRLDVPADRALSVRSVDGVCLFDGYLGLRDGMVALEVVGHNS